MKKIMLNEFTGKEIRELLESKRPVTAITCFGSCENHADHLPLGTDRFIPEAMARKIAEALPDTVVVPCTPFGTSLHYSAYPMAISLSYETNIAVAEDVFESLFRYGIERIVILNGHDGNIAALEIAARNFKERHPSATLIFLPAWWDFASHILEKGFFESWDNTGLGHGGEGETSILMAIRPDLADLKYAVKQIPKDVFNRYGVTYIWDFSEISATGATGDPTLATEEKGKAMMQAIANYVVELIKELNANDWKYDLKK